MDFRLLGPLEVRVDGRPLPLQARRLRAVLVLLLLHPNRAVSIDRLVDCLWGEAPPARARNAVQRFVSDLRRALGDREASRLGTVDPGYVLRVDPDELDTARFERLATEGRSALAVGEAARAAAALNDALALWRGPALQDFTFEQFALAEIARLDGLRLDVLELWMEARLTLGEHAAVAGELQALTADQPLREQLWALRLLGLYRCGRQADALRAYTEARVALAEVGIEPGAKLRDLEARILRQDPTLNAPASAGRRGTPTSWQPRTFLLTDVVGSVGHWERETDAMAVALEQLEAIIERAVSDMGGRVIRRKGEGDSTFSVFDRPVDAAGAAVAVQDAVDAASWPTSVPIRLRAAVSTGEAHGRGDDWFGPAVNRAARLRDLAAEGQIFVSGVTAGLVADRMPESVRLLYRGRRVLRGIDRPEEVWELVGADDPRLAADQMAKGSGLPLALTRFVGRTGDVERLVELIEDVRLVTLTGPGGSGKTRLALEAAREAARRGRVVWLADLAPLRDGALVAQTVADAVAVETGPEPLRDLLARPELLTGVLLLDNCEHVLDACAALTERLLAALPALCVLATSREPLGLVGERVWPVRPLEIPDDSPRNGEQLGRVESVALLLDRARAVRPDLEIGDNDVAAVVQICQALDGMPLAIELAGGRLRSLSLVDLAARLGDQLKLLTRHRSTGGADARHQTLRVTFDWSYDLLTEQQQRVAQRLSVFAGGFRLDAVESVCGAGLAALDSVDELVAKSLVTFDGATARYGLLEPLRQYLAERLDETGATEAVRQTHAEWVAALCHRLGTRLLEDQRARSRRLSEESSNIERALRWAHDHDHAMVAGIVGSLGQYWMFYDQAAGRRWSEVAVEAGAGVAPRARAKVSLTAGMVAQNDEAWNRSITLLREALAIYRTTDAAAGQAASLFYLGRAIRVPRRAWGAVVISARGAPGSGLRGIGHVACARSSPQRRRPESTAGATILDGGLPLASNRHGAGGR